MMRKLVVVKMVVMTLMLTACTTSTVKPTGVVTGLTAECTARAVPVKVSLYSGRTLVASTTVRAGTSYKLSAAAGAYTVEGLGEVIRSGEWTWPSVTVRAGRTVIFNSPLLGCQ
jgi:predicted small secreted protein